MTTNTSPNIRPKPHDPVDVAGKASFPASDPPAASPGPTAAPNAVLTTDLDQAIPQAVEVVEHPLSDPASRSDAE